MRSRLGLRERLLGSAPTSVRHRATIPMNLPWPHLASNRAGITGLGMIHPLASEHQRLPGAGEPAAVFPVRPPLKRVDRHSSQSIGKRGRACSRVSLRPGPDCLGIVSFMRCVPHRWEWAADVSGSEKPFSLPAKKTGRSPCERSLGETLPKKGRLSPFLVTSAIDCACLRRSVAGALHGGSTLTKPWARSR